MGSTVTITYADGRTETMSAEAFRAARGGACQKCGVPLPGEGRFHRCGEVSTVAPEILAAAKRQRHREDRARYSPRANGVEGRFKPSADQEIEDG